MAFDRDGARRTRRSKDAMCAFYLAGKCTYGDECKFSHSTSSGDTSRIPQCKFWLQGTCRHGSTCMFSHNTNAPIARVNTVTTTEEQIENLTKDMLNGTTSARVLPNGVLQYSNARSSASNTATFSYPPGTGIAPQMYYYPTAQGGYLSTNGQLPPMATTVGLNYAMLTQNGSYRMVQPAVLPGAGLAYPTSAPAQLTMQPLPPMGNSSGIKRKLENTTSKEEETFETRKKMRQEETANKTLTINQQGQVVLNGVAAQSTGSAMLLLPHKRGRPLVKEQAKEIPTRPAYGPQVAPASFLLNRQNQLIPNQAAVQQTILQSPAMNQYHALQPQMTTQPPR